ncbi:hypothetical protein CTP45_07820 [Salmonella enterica]|uniref:GNAT family N-acetyltransferase n=1 Tax=Salmonella enterica subsp. enterica serovar Saintpaul TaxID=90105 RepID=A0A5U9I8W5_SALET|nr:hypothetical protein [Salmonella enterica]EBS2301352.1 hypothetical protein [Salmonella enterica subsp. enterica serovar Saintpaul]EDW0017484.1 hypothetical protein [Salmonella enterica subsp. enterica serovar Aba]HCZ4727724.1 hypothetical protein [Salmonella enterica subsp. enterica serovar Saintpaul str. CFSAN004137]EAW8020496.1 hypothetical protein [Salmonella enterica]
MNIKLFRKAGEPTAAVPLYLCQSTRENLKLWQRHKTVEKMQQELAKEIESFDRWEFLALDEAGKVKAMLIIGKHRNAHFGYHLYISHAFSTEAGALTPGFRWVKELAKALRCDGYKLSRQTSTEGEMLDKYYRLWND